MATVWHEIFAGSNFENEKLQGTEYDQRYQRRIYKRCKKRPRKNFLLKIFLIWQITRKKVYMYNLFGAIYLKSFFLPKQNNKIRIKMFRN